jgi:hypothetical protein
MDSTIDDPTLVALGDSFALLAAANRLETHARDRASVAAMPSSLALVEETLEALARSCDLIGQTLVPAGDDARESICARLGRAAADWPGAAEGPSYEDLARILAALHDAGSALRVAGQRYAGARELLASALPPSQE